MKSKLSLKIITILLVLLFLFLPFSSWLVSLTGITSISLLRDFLVILIFCSSCLLIKKSNFKKANNKKILSLLALLLFYGIISFFWREAGMLQWLRGFRYFFMPIILYASVFCLDLEDKSKKILYYAVLISGIIILILSVLELAGINLPLITALSSEGSIEQIHYVSGEGLKRLQAVLAGPNSLALYMLALSAYALGVFKNIANKLSYSSILFGAILILTFSRSALLGLVVIFLSIIFIYANKKIGPEKALAWSASFLLLFFCIGFWLFQTPRYKQFLTHGTSSSIRVEQYKRIWNTREEIGFFGRGLGTAGLASVNRLDGGPNHFTENVYLDTFEELGYFGLLAYLLLIIYLLKISFENSATNEGKTALLILASFSITGLFINYYTGQIGIYLMWLAIGLATNMEGQKNEKNSS